MTRTTVCRLVSPDVSGLLFRWKLSWATHALLLLASAAPLARADIFVPTNSVWRFFRGTSEASTPLGTEWRTNTFNDSAWEIGSAPFYYGTNYSPAGGTLLGDMQSNYTCIFLRSTFVLSNAAQINGLTNRPFADDGFIIWINGLEIRRFNVPGSVGTFLAHTNNANSTNSSPTSFQDNAKTNVLRTGTNVLALQIFNVGVRLDGVPTAINDGDFFANPQLALGVVDVTPPFVQSITPAPGTIASLNQITVTFNEPVRGVSADDLRVNGESAISVSGTNATYTFMFAAVAAGAVDVAWDGNQVILDAVNLRFNEAGAGWTYNLVDTIAPTVASLTPAMGATVAGLSQAEVLFSEAVSGVDADDLLVNGTPATSAFGSGAGPYLFQFPQPGTGTVQLAWSAGHNIRDNAASPNAFAGGSWSLTLNPALFTGDVIINEFTAANVVTNGGPGTLDIDEFNQPSDWIELYNRGSNSVRLLGWSLTDNPNEPGLWTFPDVTLAPGTYLVVYASLLDRKTIGGTNRLHTSFGLNQNGEYLALFNAESPRRAMSEFNPQFPEQRNDYSYGLIGSNTWRYFNPPTPGAANGSGTITNVVPAVSMNVARGYFQAPFTLVASCDITDATLRHTTDGSEPLGSSAIFPATLTISNTTVLRIAGFHTGMLPSRVSTHSYIFLDQVVTQSTNPPGFPSNWGPNGSFPGGVVPADYGMDMDPLRVDPNNAGSAIDPDKLQRLKDGLRELPVLSIVMKIDDIFGTQGLYQRSAVETASKPNNQKSCSIELILPDGSTAFATTCGIDLHGNASRNPIKNPKHGYKLKFKDDFGPPKLEYKLFEDAPSEEFDDLILRPDFNSSWRHWSDTAGQGLGAFQRTRATRTRDAWIKNAMRDMGGLASHSRFFHLFLNGLYWGTFEFSEQPTQAFGQNAMGGSESDFDVIDQGALKNGTMVAYNAMLALPAATTLAQYEQYKQYLDLVEFTDYMLLHFLVGHQDWAVDVNKNWYAIRKRVSGPEGTFKYIPWDGECILLEPNVNRVTVSTPPSGLHTKLDDSPEYRLAFADRVHRHMIASDGALTPEANIARWRKWQAVMDKPIVAETARWGDYRRDVHRYSEGVYQLYTRENHWMAENTRMLGYFSNRTATVLGQLRAANLYPAVSAPVFNQQGGRVAAGFALTMTATNAIYYTTNGADPRFYGTGQVSPVARAYSGPIILGETMAVKARTLAGTNWSALNEATFTVSSLTVPLQITEIMYNPIGGDAFEFIELQNNGPIPLNVGNYSFAGINFVFPFIYTLGAGQRIVLGNNANTNAFKTRYPSVTVAGWFGGSLANGGETIAVLDGIGRTVLSVSYDDEDGWATAPDGGGQSLEVADPNGDSDDPANWRASSAQNGTPGQVNSALPAATVVINEVMAENLTAVNHEGTYPDWIELFNSSAAGVDLAGWSLSDDGNARKFVFPNGTTIAPGGYLVVWCDSTTNTTTGFHSGFALGRNGESVFLYDANANRVDAISFGPQVANYSIGRVGNAWALTTPTPNAANVSATLAPATALSINEWLANAAPGADDWLELFNTSSTAPVALRNVYFGTSNALFQLRSLSFVPPQGFVQLIADENAGPDHLDFRLSASPGAIILYDAAGAELQRVNYGAQVQGVSQGRLPDGSANIVAFPNSASPAGTNYLLNYTGPVLNELLARNSRAVAGPWGNYPDYVEIYNPGAAPFDLVGMGLSDDADEVKFTFAPGTVIGANGFLVVWCDGDRGAITNGNMNSGFSLSGSSGGAYLFNAIGQVVNSVEYGFQVQDLSIGSSGGQWSLLSAITPGAANAAPATLGSTANLRINEWMANLTGGDDWFELYNLDPLPVNMSGSFLTDDPSLAGVSNTPIAALSFIGGNNWVKWIADEHPSNGRDHVGFELDEDGDTIRIYAPDFSLIDSIAFGAQLDGVSQGRLPDGGTNIVSFPATPTPEESNYLPLPDIVINEALTHTDPPLEDAIEIQNIGANTIAIGDWFISNSQTPLKKFRIASGTTLGPGAFKVFYENQFNADASGNGTNFTLNSARGDSVYLAEADSNGNLSGYRAQVSFGAAERSVSFGRFPTSVAVDFVAMAQRTFGADNPATPAQFRTGTGLSNSYPKIGPIIFNEIMYHPVSGSGSNVTENAGEEFIELRNVTGSAVPLFDPIRPDNRWRLSGGVDFSFSSNTAVAANSYLLVVGFDPAANPIALLNFRGKYGTNGIIVGPFNGRLDNAGEALELYKPDAPQQPPHPDAGLVPTILVDRVLYAELAPWPTAADGGGASLQRLASTLYGNEPLNWKADPPTAGAANTQGALVAPTISGQPTNRTVVLNSTASFFVVANGSVPLSYQWQHANTNLPGANSATLTIADAQIADGGIYRVVVTNAAGNITSQDATLTVLAPPIISAQPQTQSAIAGSTVQLTVTAIGTAPFYYQWRFNGSALGNETNPQLTLNNVQPSIAGNYTVVITNSIGAVTSAVAVLTVRVPPTITSHPSDATVRVGDAVTFTVSATGTAPLGYQWRKDGINIAGATSLSYSIPSAQAADEGMYWVVVANSAGSTNSLPAFLRVNVPPSLANPHQRGDGLFEFTLLGQINRSYSVEFSSNFGGWTNLTNVTLSAPQAPVVDVTSTNVASRFYRVRLP